MKKLIAKFIQTLSDSIDNFSFYAEHGIWVESVHEKSKTVLCIACWSIGILSLFMIIWHIYMRFL